MASWTRRVEGAASSLDERFDAARQEEIDAVAECDNCGAPRPSLVTTSGRFCDRACGDAFDLA